MQPILRRVQVLHLLDSNLLMSRPQLHPQTRQLRETRAVAIVILQRRLHVFNRA